ncbi:MAG: hypothetical protein ACRCSU_07155, partial [Paracoccaceae bacterium]
RSKLSVAYADRKFDTISDFDHLISISGEFFMRLNAFGTVLCMAFSAIGSSAIAAHCFADVSITDGTRTTTANTNWPNRTNGNNWIQQLGNHRSECDNLAANYFNSLDVAAIAKEKAILYFPYPLQNRVGRETLHASF